MPNVPALGALLHALLRPGLVVPHVAVASIAHLDWRRMHAAGVRALVCDKDNCLTKPHDDSLAPAIREAWHEAIEVFGRENILIVSNSAGSSSDPHGLGAENLSRELWVPVLAHPAKKPARACVRQVVDVLRPRGHVLVIGDRPTTDVVMAHRLDRALSRQHRSSGARAAIEPAQSGSSAGAADLIGADTTGILGRPRAFAVLTTHLWAPERLGTRLMRGAEYTALRLLARRSTAPGGGWRRSSNTESADWLALALRPAPAAEVRSTPPPPARAQQAGLLAVLLSQPSLPRWVRPPLRALLFVSSTRPARWLGRWLGRAWNMVGEGVRLGTDARLRSPRFLPSLQQQQRARLGAPARGSRGYATAPPPREPHAAPAKKAVQPRGSPSAPASAKAAASPAGTSAPPSQSQPRVPDGEDLRPIPRPRHVARPRPGIAVPPRSSPQGKSEAPAEPLVPPPSKIRGWLPALLALVIIPTGWYAGVALHEYRNEIHSQRDGEADAAEGAGTASPAAAPAAAAPQPMSSQPAVSAKVKAEQQAALEREAYHVARELKDLQEKQLRLQERAAKP